MMTSDQRDREKISRRLVLGGMSAATAVGLRGLPARAEGAMAQPVPLSSVKLRPSIFLTAQNANRRYLKSLSPDRLLHNFVKGAGFEPKAPVYGGWEAASIAGHSLGHWLTASSIMVANTGDSELQERLTYAVSELARVQASHGDGYVAGTTTWGAGDNINGKAAYEDLRKGNIRGNPFSLNECWVPIYTWHKVHAGLIDAHKLAAIPGALQVAVGMAEYFGSIIEGLNDAQVQHILATEHGGISEVFAELSALTGQGRWMTIARRLKHDAIIDPLAAEVDELAGKHANTQIPKVIARARIYELTGDESAARAARFFHKVVTRDHSYVIGGNSDREHFNAPGVTASAVTETTCEACNTYNMLKLTRHLYGWQPEASLFDDYERAQLNHIMAHQRPDTGMFVYFMPMAAGGRRSYSTPEDSFWCCVGSGMESHAKHADSIFWQRSGDLYVNLFIPSSLDLPDAGLALELETRFPDDGEVALKITRGTGKAFAIRVRLPSWGREAAIKLNGDSVSPVVESGYAVIRREWRAGDILTLSFPMTLRAEPAPDDKALVAFLSGPLVLAADVGPADKPFEDPTPALISEGAATQGLKDNSGVMHTYNATSATQNALIFKPFYNMYDHRAAVYIPVFSNESWAKKGAEFLEIDGARRDLAKRTLDIAYLGEQQPEVDHAVVVANNEITQINGRSARRIRPGEPLSLRLVCEHEPMLIRLTFWGKDSKRSVRLTNRGKALSSASDYLPIEHGFEVMDFAFSGASEGRHETFTVEAIDSEVTVYEIRSLLAPPVS